jgi:putative MATE family efflux protein
LAAITKAEQQAKPELTQQEARRQVIALAWPAVVEQLLVTLFGMVDMMMVGSVGPYAIAAIGLTNQPMLLALAAFQALNVGTTALVARFVGAEDISEANATIRQSLLVVFVLAGLASALVYIFAKPMVVFMGATGETLGYAVTYLRVISLGLLPQTVGMCVTAVLRGAGDTKTPMRFNIIANVFNVIGNFLLIAGRFGFPAWGVFGAAIATTVSRLIGCALSLYVVFSGRSLLHISLRDRFVPRWDLISRVVRVGFPSMLEQLLMRFGNIVFTKTVSGLGMATYAAHQIGMNIQSLSFTPGHGFGMAATSLVGRSLGEKRPDKAEKYGWQTRRIGQYVAVTMGLLFFFGGRQIASLYTDDPAVIGTAALVLKVSAFIQPFQSSQFILAGALRGAGDTRWPLISTFVGVAGIRALLAVLFVNVLRLGVVGAWYALLLDQFTRSLVVYYRYNSKRWQKAQV